MILVAGYRLWWGPAHLRLTYPKTAVDGTEEGKSRHINPNFLFNIFSSRGCNYHRPLCSCSCMSHSMLSVKPQIDSDFLD